jgi:hypothetical protein
MYFCTCDLNLTCAEPGLNADFVFYLQVHPKPEKNPETQKNPRKNSKPKRNKKTPERNPFTKPDGHPNLTQNRTSSVSGAKFHLRVQVSNSTRLYFFTDQVFDQPDLLPFLIEHISDEVGDGTTFLSMQPLVQPLTKQQKRQGKQENRGDRGRKTWKSARIPCLGLNLWYRSGTLQ